ncbi:MAG: hypothetical protein AAGF11_41145 [Myxococcota bacterium]
MKRPSTPQWLVSALLAVSACIDPADAGESPAGATADSETADTANNANTAGPGETTAGAGSTGATDGTPDDTTDDPTTGEDPTGEGEDESSTGAPGQPEGVPMFVALGQGGRRLLSCDDGHSWVGEQIVEMNDDDHGPYSSRSITWGEGTFMIGMGWGNPGKLWRSENGLDWQETFPPPDHDPTGLSGVIYGGGRFVAVEGRRTWHSEDRGLAWTPGDNLAPGEIIRTVGYSPYDGGRYYAVGGGEIHVSSDGQTWSAPGSVQGSCEGNVSRRGGVVADGDLFVVVTDTGNVCRTDDGGQTFTHHVVGPGPGNGAVVRSNLVVTNEGFYAAGGSGAWTSADGIDWQSHAFALDGDPIRRLARGDTGTLVGIAWNGDDFYRSDDGGLQWLPSDAPAGNDTNQVTFGYATASDTCPQ